MQRKKAQPHKRSVSYKFLLSQGRSGQAATRGPEATGGRQRPMGGRDGGSGRQPLVPALMSRDHAPLYEVERETCLRWRGKGLLDVYMAALQLEPKRGCVWRARRRISFRQAAPGSGPSSCFLAAHPGSSAPENSLQAGEGRGPATPFLRDRETDGPRPPGGSPLFGTAMQKARDDRRDGKFDNIYCALPKWSRNEMLKAIINVRRQ